MRAPSGPLWEPVSRAGGGTKVVLVPVREQKSGAWVWNEQRMQQLIELLQAEKVKDIKPFPQTLAAVMN